MASFCALIVSAVAGYLPHLLFGSHLDVMGEFLAGTVVGGAAYVFTYYKLKKWQSGL
ncbi:MAG TPA: hypothetical protein VHB21_09490 [Minicystis sp.]|nr:hypothetical protein [Minicystis sp.]